MQNLRSKAIGAVFGILAFLVPAGGCPGGPAPDTMYTPSTDSESSGTDTGSTSAPTTSGTTAMTDVSTGADSTTADTPQPDFDLPPPVPCCKFCGPNSKACGDSCIANVLNCHKPAGCACEGVLPQ